MQIAIDPHHCVASGMCVALAPERFASRRGPTTVVAPVVAATSHDLDVVIDAVDCCPGAAIRLEQETDS